jgi:hypothetical protein
MVKQKSSKILLLSDDEVNDLYEYSDDEDEAIHPFD